MSQLEKYPSGKTLKTDRIGPMSKAERKNWINREVVRVGYVPLTPILLSDPGERFAALQVLEEREKGELREDTRMYLLRVFRDSKGEPTKPGDTFTYKYGIRKVHPQTQKPLTTRNKNDFARRGESTDLTVTKVLDEHLCIQVRREDAVSLLMRNGVGICEREWSSDRSCCYGVLEEVPPWEYEELQSPAEPRGTAQVSKAEKIETGDSVGSWAAEDANSYVSDPLVYSNRAAHEQAGQTIAKARKRSKADVG